MILKYVISDTKYENINQILKQEFHVSTRLQHKLIKNKHIYLNNKIIDTRSSVSINDIITVDLDFDEESDNIIATNMQLNIVYEDNCFLILNKPAGIAVHPSMKHYNNSIGLHKKIRPINRLDLNTSGLVIFAKNEYVQETLSKQMAEKMFQKYYIAIVEGIFEKKIGTINLPIARKENSIIERCISPMGQESITDYEVINEFDSLSVVKCHLQTGRTHQIRVHMSAIGHPLLGDTLYGTSSTLISRQALHSYKISFIHPITNQNMNFTCELPDDMNFIQKNHEYILK